MKIVSKFVSRIQNGYYKAMASATVFALTSSPAMAQGAINIANNMNRFLQVAVTVLIAGGVLGGLGTIAYAVTQMVKKGDQRGDDITWMSIGLKFVGGAFLLALSWVGVTVIETLGGNAGDVGRNI